MMDALQKIIEREATEGIESLSWLEVTIHGAYWRKRHEPAHPGLVEAAQELAQLQVITTVARELCKELRIPIYGYDIRTTWECYSKGHEDLEAALAALEQETK